jgi:hypothetical protein
VVCVVGVEGSCAWWRAAAEVPGGGNGGGGWHRSGGGGDRCREASMAVEETDIERRRRDCDAGRRGLRVLG